MEESSLISDSPSDLIIAKLKTAPTLVLLFGYCPIKQQQKEEQREYLLLLSILPRITALALTHLLGQLPHVHNTLLNGNYEFPDRP